MSTSAIIKFEVSSWMSLAAAVGFVWGNALYVIAVIFFFLSFRILYLRSQFKKVITETAQDATDSVWSNITTEMSLFERASDEQD